MQRIKEGKEGKSKHTSTSTVYSVCWRTGKLLLANMGIIQGQIKQVQLQIVEVGKLERETGHLTASSPVENPEELSPYEWGVRAVWEDVEEL